MKIIFIVALFACSLCIVHAQVKTITIDQLELALTSKEDTVFVVNFWATWCKPCIEELPYFEEAHKDFEQANVHVLLVSLDMPKELGKTLIPFIQKRNMHSEIVLLEAQDPNSWIDRIEPAWSGSLPATIIYNGLSKKRKFFEKQLNREELFSTIKEMME